MQQWNQEQEDALFTLLMYNVAQQEGQRALAENEQLAQDDRAALSPQLQARCMQTIQRGQRQRDARAVRHAAGRILGRVAAAVLAAVLCFTVAFAVSPAVRAGTVRWVTNSFGDHMELRPTQNARSGAGNNWRLHVGWTPEGMTLTDEDESFCDQWLFYADDCGNTLSVQMFLPGELGVMSIDTEDASARQTEVGGCAAFTMEKNGIASVTWLMDDQSAILRICGSGVSMDDVMRMAESISLRQAAS